MRKHKCPICIQISGGGVYYMISRALGPALGGSIGLMFTVANTISVATYTIGFAESLLDFLADLMPSWDGIVVSVVSQTLLLLLLPLLLLS